MESNGDEVIRVVDDSYYEELASSEEVYVEEIEEDLRSELISNTPQDDCPDRALDTAVELYRETQASLFRK